MQKLILSSFIFPLIIAWILWVSSGLVESAEKFATISQKLDHIIESIEEIKMYYGTR